MTPEAIGFMVGTWTLIISCVYITFSSLLKHSNGKL